MDDYPWLSDSTAAGIKRAEIKAATSAFQGECHFLLSYLDARAEERASKLGPYGGHVTIKVEPGFSSRLIEELTTLVNMVLLPPEWLEWIPNIRGTEIKLPRAVAAAIAVPGFALWKNNVSLGSYADPFMIGVLQALLATRTRKSALNLGEAMQAVTKAKEEIKVKKGRRTRTNPSYDDFHVMAQAAKNLGVDKRTLTRRLKKTVI